MAVGLQTPLCRELGIEYPIFSVGFSVSAGLELVAAVSNAGGCGVLGGGAGGAMLSDELRRRIRRVRQLTQAPFGLNFIIAWRIPTHGERKADRNAAPSLGRRGMVALRIRAARPGLRRGPRVRADVGRRVLQRRSIT
jgi:NAD(P)H-dependent flavin oxidoreductase YrpB (nitropropane dioxygenase family)